MKQPQEYKVVSLRECPTPESLLICETPEQVADYWRLNIATNPYYNPECEMPGRIAVEYAAAGQGPSVGLDGHNRYPAG